MLLLYFAIIWLQISNLGAEPGVTKVEISFTSTAGKQFTGKIEFEESDITWVKPGGLEFIVNKFTKQKWRKVSFVVSRAKFEEKLQILRMTSTEFFQLMKSPTANKVGACYKGQERIELSNDLSANYAEYGVKEYVPRIWDDHSYQTFEYGSTSKEVRIVEGLGAYLCFEGYLKV